MSFSRASTGRQPIAPPPKSSRAPGPPSSSSYFDIYGRRTTPGSQDPPPLPTNRPPILRATPKPVRGERPDPRVKLKAKNTSSSSSPLSVRSGPSRSSSPGGSSTTTSSAAGSRVLPATRTASSSLSVASKHSGVSRPPPSPGGSTVSSSSRSTSRSRATPDQKTTALSKSSSAVDKQTNQARTAPTGERPPPLPATALNPRTTSLATDMHLLARTLSTLSDRSRTRSPTLGPPTPKKDSRPSSPIYDRFTASPSPPPRSATPKPSSGKNSPISRPHPLKSLILVASPPGSPSISGPSSGNSIMSLKSSSSRRSILVEPPTPPPRTSSMQVVQHAVTTERGRRVSRESLLSGTIVAEVDGEEEQKAEVDVEREEVMKDDVGKDVEIVRPVPRVVDPEEDTQIEVELGLEDKTKLQSPASTKLSAPVHRADGYSGQLDDPGMAAEVLPAPPNAAFGSVEAIGTDLDGTIISSTAQPVAECAVSVSDLDGSDCVPAVDEVGSDCVPAIDEVQEEQGVCSSLSEQDPWHASSPSGLPDVSANSIPVLQPTANRQHDPPNIPTEASGSMTPPRTPSPSPLLVVSCIEASEKVLSPKTETNTGPGDAIVSHGEDNEVIDNTPALTLTTFREEDEVSERIEGAESSSEEQAAPQCGPDYELVTEYETPNRNSFLGSVGQGSSDAAERELHPFPRAVDSLAVFDPFVARRLSSDSEFSTMGRSGSGRSSGSGRRRDDERRERGRKKEARRARERGQEREDDDDYGRGNDEIVTSVSTDMMDSFIDELNPGASKSLTRPIWRAPDEVTLRSEAEYGPKYPESASPRSQRRRRIRKASHESSSPSDSDEQATMPWKRVGKDRWGHARTLSKPKQPEPREKALPPQPIAIETPTPKAREATTEELRAIALELGGKDLARPSIIQPKPSSELLSIDEIIKRHASASPNAFGLHRKKTVDKERSQGQRSPPLTPTSSNTPTKSSSRNPKDRLSTLGMSESMKEAALRSHLLLEKLESVDEGLEMSGDVGLRRSGETSSSGMHRTASGTSKRPLSISVQSSSSVNSGSSWDTLKRSRQTESPEADQITSLTAYLKSHRLTRLVTLQRNRNLGHVVSLADVGDPEGYPVVVFLGLGCVRYLIALFDEIARTLNIRLICIDRWGLGKSTDVTDERRGMMEWAQVVEEVMDRLEIDRFGVLAHSAGAPYALATALKLKSRVMGKLHLLAPWVNVDVDGSYKWLKYVPSGVIKTAQATEWKFQGWMLGKLPRTPTEAIGHNAHAARSFDVNSGPSDAVRQDLSYATTEGSSAEDSDYSLIQELSKLEDFQLPQLNPLTRSVTIDGLPRSHSREASRSSSAMGMSSMTDSRGSFESLIRGTPRADTSSRPGNSSSSFSEPRRWASTAPEGLSRSGSFAQVSHPRRSDALSVASNLTGSASRSSTPAQAPLSSGATLPRSETPFFVTLLQASHAEALAGGTSDLLAVLGKGSKPWGFSYKDVHHSCKIWFGDRDDKISEKSMRWMEKEMDRAELILLKGEGHNLMMSARVMMAVLESLSQDGKAWRGPAFRGLDR